MLRKILLGLVFIVLLCVGAFIIYIDNIVYDFALAAPIKIDPSLKFSNPNIPVHLQIKNANRSTEEIEAIKQTQEEARRCRNNDISLANDFFKNKKQDKYILSFDNLKLHAVMVLFSNDVQITPSEEIHDEKSKKPIDKLGEKVSESIYESIDNEQDVSCDTYTTLQPTQSNDVKNNDVKERLISHKWVIIAHGYRDNALLYFPEGKHFYDLGYNVLFTESRGHGISEGGFLSMGWYERIDMKQWINQIIDWDPQAQIVLYGVGMGATTVMMTLGEKLPANVKVGIEDCGYTSAYSIFRYNLPNMFGFNRFSSVVILNSLSLYVRLKDWYWLTDASAVKQLKNNKIPTLFIHGDSDTFVPTEMVDKVFEACGTRIRKKEKVIIKGSPNCMNDYTDSDLYWSSVTNFLGRYITV